MPRTTNPELKPVYIRLWRDDVAEARRVAEALKLPYQRVIRDWVNRRATESRDESKPRSKARVK